MIKFLLQEIEKSPNPLFTKKELISISLKEFDNLTKKKILTYCNPKEGNMEVIRFPRCQHGCPLYVREIEGKLEAICLGHPEEDPISIDEDDLSRYVLSIDMLLVQIRTANRIDGKLQRLNGGYFYIGYKTYNSNQAGFIFIYKFNGDELIRLSALKRLCKDDDILVVLTPVSVIEDLVLKENLRHENIIQTSLLSSLNIDNFELPIEKLISGLIKPKAVEKDPITEQTAEQRADYKTFEYQCYDKIHIPGTISTGQSNDIIVNGDNINIGNSLFVLLLRFIAELKEGKGGWIDIYTLESEGIITDAAKYQIYSRLRTELRGSLQDRDGQKFIQSNGSKQYRVSVHPDFINYDKERLINHPDYRIKGLAHKLPENQ